MEGAALSGSGREGRPHHLRGDARRSAPSGSHSSCVRREGRLKTAACVAHVVDKLGALAAAVGGSDHGLAVTLGPEGARRAAQCVARGAVPGVHALGAQVALSGEHHLYVRLVDARSKGTQEVSVTLAGGHRAAAAISSQQIVSQH